MANLERILEDQRSELQAIDFSQFVSRQEEEELDLHPGMHPLITINSWNEAKTLEK